MFSIRITLQPQRRRRQIIKKVEWILRAREREIKCTLSFPKKLLFSIDSELMETRTVRVGNISDLAGEREIREFFSFSGDIESIEIRGGASSARIAFVTFREPRALEIALLLSGATIVDRIVNISPVENYIPVYEEQTVVNEAEIATCVGNNNANVEEKNNSTGGRAYVTKAHVVVSSVLAKSSALRQDAISKAKAFDEKHRLSASASEKVISLDRRIKFSEKVTVGISIVNEKVKSVDQKLQVSDKTMAAIIAAERKLNNTGTAVKANRYVTAGTAWLNGAFGKVAKAGHVAGSRTREKFQLAVSNLTAKDPVVAA